jgi:hypothetical protein
MALNELMKERDLRKYFIMKKIPAVIALFSMLFLIAHVSLKAQVMAKVTVTIKSLTSASQDACGEMDFYAKILIGNQVKTFPVMEGHHILPNWQFVTTTKLNIIPVRIVIMDEDDAFCGGGDDTVCVDGNTHLISTSFRTREHTDRDFSPSGLITGPPHGIGRDDNRLCVEKANIIFNITIEPTKTALLTQFCWKEMRQEARIDLGAWEDIPLSSSACESDNCHIFKTSFSNYELNEGATKCSLANPRVIKTGIWSFQTNETEILLRTSSTPTIFSVEHLDEHELILTSISTIDGHTQYKRITYRH